MTDQPPIHYRLLHEHIIDALHRQKNVEAAEVLAQKLDKGEWRGIAEFKLDDDDRIDPNTLTYRIDIRDDAGTWVPLCYIHWSRLGLEWADVLFEVRSLKRQHGEGTFPGGPNDPHRP